MYGWNERPAKAAVKNLIGGDDPKTVFQVGQYEVTVPGDDVEITYRIPYHRQTDPRTTFPNMEVHDGEIRIPVADMVDEVLSRIEPVELAQALWTNDDVKSEFMDCLTTRYNGQGINDNDRRDFLKKVKEAVHNEAVDRLAVAMAKCEFEISRRSHYYHEIQRINETLRELDVKIMRGRMNENGDWVTEPTLLQFNALDRSEKHKDGTFTRGELEISGKAWEEARAHWRDEVSKRFPAKDAQVTA